MIEEESCLLGYWASGHSPGKLDFRQPAAFARQIEPPDMEPVNAVELEKG